MTTSFQLMGMYLKVGRDNEYRATDHADCVNVQLLTCIHISSFGDLRTKDKSVFPLHDPKTQGLQGFEQVHLLDHRHSSVPLPSLTSPRILPHPCRHLNTHPVTNQQVIEAYHRVVPTLKFSGPTSFAPLIGARAPWLTTHTHTNTHTCTHTCTHTYTHSLIHSLTHSLTHSHAHTRTLHLQRRRLNTRRETGRLPRGLLM